MLEKYLQDIGLNDKEALIYTALLSFENASALEIANKTKIKRPTVYVILESLAKKGLVSEITVGKKTNYYAEPPERLETFLERKIINLEESKKILKDIVPQLKSVIRESGERPVVKFFEGKEGIVSVNREMLQNLIDNKEPMFALYPKDLVDEVLSMEELKKLRANRTERNIKTISIYTTSKEEKPSDTLANRLRIDGSKYPLQCDITVYKDLTLISILGKKISAIGIKNNDVAETLKSVIRLVHDLYKN